MTSKLLTGLLADERRNMVISSPPLAQQQYRHQQPTNEKYSELLNREQTIRENIGILYNDDSRGQLNGQSVLPGNPLAGGQSSLIIEPRYLVINSADRDWINRTDESPYSYTVSVGGASLANGKAINITVNSTLENVVSLKCEGLILTNRAHQNGFKPSNQPFILVSLESIGDVVRGSNKYLDNSLAQMVNKIPFPTSLDNIRYVQLVNQSLAKKIFQTPESKLGRLTFQITRADGQPMLAYSGSQRDTVSILRIYYDPASTDQTLTIYTTGYFSGLDWQAGDIIQIRTYTMRGTNPVNMGFYERVKFNNWINQDAGHIIQDIAKDPDDDQALYNIIKIKAPGDWLPSTGNFELYSWFDDLLTKTEIDINSGTDTGKILNENLQTTVFITAEVITKNSMALLRTIAPAK
jgi:hypothetical protein